MPESWLGQLVGGAIRAPAGRPRLAAVAGEPPPLGIHVGLGGEVVHLAAQTSQLLAAAAAAAGWGDEAAAWEGDPFACDQPASGPSHRPAGDHAAARPDSGGHEAAHRCRLMGMRWCCWQLLSADADQWAHTSPAAGRCSRQCHQ